MSRALPEWAKDVSDLHWSWRREQRLKEFTFQQEREFERQDYWGADSYDDLTSNRRETSVADAEASLQARRALQSHNIQEDLFAFGFFIIEVRPELRKLEVLISRRCSLGGIRAAPVKE